MSDSARDNQLEDGQLLGERSIDEPLAVVRVTETGTMECEQEELHSIIASSFPDHNETPSAFFLDVGDVDSGGFEQELQHQLNLREEEIIRLTAKIKELEFTQQEQVERFTAEIEELKHKNAEAVEGALSSSMQAQEELEALRVKNVKDMDDMLVECEEKHAEKVHELRTELESVKSELELEKHGKHSDKWESLVPKHSPHLSPQMKKELRLQRERLQRQHRCELKAQEQKLRSELSLQTEMLQSKLEEEYTVKLAKLVTESALKNASQVDQISQQLRLEKQRAVSQLKEEQEEQYRKDAARLADERREAVETCRAEFESARAGYQSKIEELEIALASEREKQMATPLEQDQGRVDVEQKLQGELTEVFKQQLEKVQTECAQDKETCLMHLREALENQLQTELRNAQEIHKQSLIEQQSQLQETFAKELISVQRHADELQSQLHNFRQQAYVQEGNIEAIKEQLAKENMLKINQMTEKLQEVHKATILSMEAQKKADFVRHQEETDRVREEYEARLHEEMQQLTQSHKAEVRHLQEQYQTQLDKSNLTREHAIAQVHESVKQDVRSILAEQHALEVEQLKKAHETQLIVVEENGAKRVAEVSRELEQIKEHNASLLAQLTTFNEELSQAQILVEEQRNVINQKDEENQKIKVKLQEAGSRERERLEHGDRQHHEDTASLTILQKQLSAISDEKASLLSSLAILQSSVIGCLQLTNLIEQTLNPPSSTSQAQWHTLSTLHVSTMEDEVGKREEEDTLTPPASTTSPSSVVASVPSTTSSVMWSKNSTSHHSGSLFRQTPSDDSGLASQQASVVNSEATLVITPLMNDVEEGTPSSSIHSPHQSPQPPNLTILPLEDTTVSHDMSQAPLPYDQSQVGMLSISFLDTTNYPANSHHAHSFIQSHDNDSILPSTSTTQASDIPISSLNHSLPPPNISNLPELQERLSSLHGAVSSLLERYISVSAEAADCHQKIATSSSQLREALSSQTSLMDHIAQLENQVKVKDERLERTEHNIASIQEKFQIVANEVEEMKVKNENLQLQLSTVQESLVSSQQQERETQELLREKTEELNGHKLALTSLQNGSQQQVQMLNMQVVQFQEELQTTQTNCANAVHEKEAMHEENKRLAQMQVSLDGQLHSLREESLVMQQEYKNGLKQKEDEIRELQTVKVEFSSHQEAMEILRAEKDDLQQQLNNVEHQLALCQVVSVEQQMTRIQELMAKEAQLTSDLRQQEATCQALQERVKVAQESLNQTTQENLSVKISQAQLEGEVNRLREELQRRETSLHRAQVESDRQAHTLSEALSEITQLKTQLKEDRVEQEDEEDKMSSESEGDQVTEQPADEPDRSLVLHLQQELQQQHEVASSLRIQIGLLQDTLNSKDRELEALRMARSHQDQTLKHMRIQLNVRDKEKTEPEIDIQERDESICKEDENTLQSSHSSTSTLLQDVSSTSSILMRLAELGPVLSEEAQTVNQLTKNIHLPRLNIDQLRSSVDSLSHIVKDLSEKNDGSSEGLIGVLEALQRLVQELTVLLSSIDQDNMTQLPQQLSAVNELLSQLISTDRQALVQNTNSLMDSVAMLQAQLQNQTHKVYEENSQLKQKLEEAEQLLKHNSDMSKKQRVMLKSCDMELENEQLATQTALSQLETEVKGLKSLLASATSDLEEAQSRLAEYQQAEHSLELSAHTISSLHQELRASKDKEAELETAVRELSFSKSELETQQTTAQMEHTTALASLKNALQRERAAKNELYTHLSAVENQLQEVQESQQAEISKRRLNVLRMENTERELNKVHEVARKAEKACAEKVAEIGKLQALLQAMESDSGEQGVHYSQLLDIERRMVTSLRSSLQAKEHELTETMDKLLQEKVGSAKIQGELTVVKARLNTSNAKITSLQSKLSAVNADMEGKARDNIIQQLELEKVRRQVLQLQEHCSGVIHERQQLKTVITTLQDQITALQSQNSQSQERIYELHNVVKDKEREVARLQQLTSQKVQRATAYATSPETLLQAKLTKLYAKYREAEVHRKALVFQKNYLKCQVDAFFQTQQAALVIMTEMGAPSAKKTKAKSYRHKLLKFKTAVHVVVAVLRFQYVIRRKHQYIQSYSKRIEREKAGMQVSPDGQHTGSRPAISVGTSFSPSTKSVTPPIIVSTVSARQLLPSSTQPKSSSVQHSQANGSTPNLSKFIPVISRLQNKLSGTVN